MATEAIGEDQIENEGDESCSEYSASSDDISDGSVEDCSMTLSDLERSLALRIKQAVENSIEFSNLSDMEYAHHAIVVMGDFNLALSHIQAIQTFREEYQVDNTPSQCDRYLRQFMALQPGVVLNLDICPDTGEPLIAFNRGGLDPEIALKCSIHDTVPEQNWKIHIISYYYMLRIVQPSLAAIRQGISFLWDGHQFTWKNINPTFTKRLLGELCLHYPFKVKQVQEYNSNAVSTMHWSIIKSLLPDSWFSVLEFGCQIETDSQRTLSELYLQPTLEQAEFHILRRAHELLAIRARNEDNFRFDFDSVS
jgi:hypothetical protein